ncbi:MAG: prolipoprotein diacylglyceryl transferase family protein [Myxococcota bacterium]|nr:prolipoprotein diacylglyceryl transferase family protein [Myxococcota bacterium]
MLATLPFWDPDQFPLSIHLFELDGVPIALRSFGVLAAFGFWFGTEVAARKAQRDGLNPEIPRSLIGWLILGAWIGGRLSHELFYEDFFARISTVPMEVLTPMGGLSSIGGLTACILIVIWRLKIVEKVPFWPYADTVVYGLMFGWIFGRLGCASVHDHPGIVSSFPLAVDGICEGGWGDTSVACHDLGLYEALWAMTGAAIFKWLDRKPRPAGFFVSMIALLYGPFRFSSDFLRTIDIRHLGLTAAQWWAVGMVLTGIIVLVLRRNAKPYEPVAQGPVAEG